MEIDPHFAHDNILVWKILYGILRGTSYHPYIKPFLEKQDGREAFKALHAHLLGTQAINTYAAKAENALHSLHLDGTKKSNNWNLDKYIQAHMDQHAILEKLTKHGHQGIGEQQKIHYFLQGITSPSLTHVKSSLAVNPKSTFQETANAFKTFTTAEAQNKRNTKPALNISSVNSSTGNRARDKQSYNGPTPKSDGYDPDKDYSAHKIAQRFYGKDEWPKLTKGQRNYLRQNRKNKKDSNKENKRKIAELTREVESLKEKSGSSSDNKKKKAKDDDSEYSPSDSDDSVKPAPSKRAKRTRVTSKKR